MAGSALLDSYEAERRPVAVRIVATGDAFEGNQTMTMQRDRAQRDDEMRHTFADPSSSHHEAAAAAEIDRSYAGCGLVGGAECDQLPPGSLLPNTIPVVSAAGDSCELHQLTHRVGHTVFVLGGSSASREDVLTLVTAIEELAQDSLVIDVVLGFCAGPGGPGVGRIDGTVARELGVEALTVLAVRPDRYIGLRHDGKDLGALVEYLRGFSD
jgi:hypothetical protein